MAYEFKKIAEVEALDKVPNGANALIEVNGEVKRVPGSGLGGGIATAIIKSSDYDSGVAGTSVTYSCINMTYDEVCQILTSGKPLAIMSMIRKNGKQYNEYASQIYFNDTDNTIYTQFNTSSVSPMFYWNITGVHEPR